MPILHRPFARLAASAMLATFLASAASAASFQDSKPTPAAAPAAKDGPAYVRMTTNKGEIVIELDRAKAPITVENFLAYTQDGFYDGTVYHRVIPTFMIQGGGFDTNGKQKSTKKPIKNEGSNGLSNSRGTIAMARTNDPDSATAQFFINVVDNPNLDTMPGRPGYAVFGKVVKGMEVVDAIRATPTGTKMATPTGAGRAVSMRDWPVEEVVIEKVVEITPEEAKGETKPTAATPPSTPKAAE